MEEDLNQVHTKSSTVASPRFGASGITIASGKGGVGKTNVVANLAASLAAMGNEVLVIDADFGLSNLDVLLGLSPRHHIGHFLSGDKRLDEVLVTGPAGIHILPAASGLQSLTSLSTEARAELFDRLDELCARFDFVLIDTAAGISANVTDMLTVAARAIVVTDPEPTALVDAYALIKVMKQLQPKRTLQLLVNSVRAESEATNVYKQIRATTERFLSVSVDLFGWVDRDPTVERAVRDQKLVVADYPDSAAAQSFLALAKKLDGEMKQGKRRPGKVLPFREGTLVPEVRG